MNIFFLNLYPLLFLELLLLSLLIKPNPASLIHNICQKNDYVIILKELMHYRYR